MWFHKWFVSRKQYEVDMAGLFGRGEKLHKDLQVELLQMRQTLKNLTDERDQLRDQLAATIRNLNAEIAEFDKRAEKAERERDALAGKLKAIKDLACDLPVGHE